MVPEDILKWWAQCELVVDAIILDRIPRDGTASVLLSERILHRVPVDVRIDVLAEIIKQDGYVAVAYTELASNLKAVNVFRNIVAHSMPGRDPLSRVQVRRGKWTDHQFTEQDVERKIRLAHDSRDILWTLLGAVQDQTKQLRARFGVEPLPPAQPIDPR